jgi:hypothetical protein
MVQHGMMPSTQRNSMSASRETAMPAVSKALLLCNGDLSANDRSVGELLDFFGVPWEIVRISQNADRSLFEGLDCDQYRLLGSAPAMAEAFQSLSESRGSCRELREKVTSVYIYGFQPTDACNRLLNLLTGDTKAIIRRLDSTRTVISVTSEFPETCGPMSGLRVSVMPTEADQVFDLHGAGETFHRIISTDDGEVFAKVTYEGRPFYLSACRDTIDINASSQKPFDVKDFFCSAVPITMYLKWAYDDVCWKSAGTRACLIVDDPPLKPRYGFLRFRRAVELMDEHNFTMSLAFIPWNWERTDPKVVDLFKDRCDKFSLSIHGCDHTASEFAAQSTVELNAKTKVASQRMEYLRQRTSLAYDRVMVFPQGEFSAETGRVLKLNGFVAAANTEVTPSKQVGSRTTITDLWDVAINKYGTFPIFTRRYLTHGIENFAFDILLGKPCLVVSHHQGFEDDGHDLVEFIDRLNSLPCKLVWGSLGEVVSHSYRTRCEPDRRRIIQMYANHVFAENPATDARTIEFMKEESDPDCVDAVMVNQQTSGWSCEAGYLRFSVTIPPKQTAEVRIIYANKMGTSSYPNDIRYRVKTGLRRYLSEARDNYISGATVLSKSVCWIRQLLK